MDPEILEGWLEHKPKEVTLEVNPEAITFEKLKAFQQKGVNRFSLGVQSLKKEELLFLGRKHTSSSVIETLKNLEELGANNVSIDLMYDVPGQTLDDLKDSLLKLKHLPFTHLSLYNLTIEPHTPFYRRKEELERQRPSPEESRAQFLLAKEMLEDFGFEHYEISAFAKPGFRAIHNSGYWLGREFFGIGPSSFSFLKGERLQNFPNLHQWKDSIDQGLPPISSRDLLDERARKRELFVLNLRWLDGVSLDTFGPIPEDILPNLLPLVEKGWIQRDLSRPRLTLEGILFFDEIATDLI